MTKFARTDEQQKIIDAVHTYDDVVIEAGAGVGKTTILREIGEELAPDHGLYVAYNKSVQVAAAASFPKNVDCRTGHSLAYRTYGVKMQHRLNADRISRKDYARILKISAYSFTDEHEIFHNIQPYRIATMVREAIDKFCMSNDKTPGIKHVWIDGFKNEGLRRHVAKYLIPAWEDICDDDNGQLDCVQCHNYYLKRWALSDPVLNYDFILYDEAQDANPCMVGVVMAQDCQKIFVGDRAQAIYGWNGAVDAMTDFDAPHRLYLSQSFRFGPAVAEFANKFLERVDTPLRLKGFDQIDSKVEPSGTEFDAILCRTNGGVIEQAMLQQRAGKRVAIAGGTSEIKRFAEAAQKLLDAREGEDVYITHPLLAPFKDWGEVVQAVEDGEASDLRTMVKIINDYGTDAVIRVCNTSVAADKADIVISTAHKAKGLEWERVLIGSDFKAPTTPNEEGKFDLPKSEWMLLYVAVTRARKLLNAASLAWVDTIDMLNKA